MASANRQSLRISPLRYPGGKGALYGRLRALIRQSGLVGCTYVEPYAGGVGAGLALLFTGQIEQLVINDLDPAINAFWRTATTESEWLIDRIASVRLDIDEWSAQKEIQRNPEGRPLSDVGFAAFYLNRTNRSGVLNGGPIGGLAQTGNYLIDARFNRDSLIERFRLIALYADQITVLARDGSDVIASYLAVDHCFVYADPPYFEKAGSLYLNAFEAHDHCRLAETLNAAPDAYWLLTYDDVPQVAELYSDRRRRRLSLNYSVRRVRPAIETVVLSDALPDVGDAWYRPVDRSSAA